MTEKKVKIIASATVTPCGDDTDSALDNFFRGEQCLTIPKHFDSKGLQLGVCGELDEAPRSEVSRAEKLLMKLLPQMPYIGSLPSDTTLYLATTVGSIDLLEYARTGATLDCTKSLLETAANIFKLKNVRLVSAACASGQKAAVMAAEMLKKGKSKYALIIGCDISSEFVTSGFFSLGALSKGLTRPYDIARDGLSLGEAAGAMLLAAEDTPESPEGYLLGWGETCDATHITAPDNSGNELVNAIHHALKMSKLTANEICGVMGHGTGTIYNDQAEIIALNIIFNDKPCPLYSLKGNIGHTLGATGVLQNIFALKFVKRQMFPPQAGLIAPMAGAENMVSTASAELNGVNILSLNIGFGGLNSAVVLEGVS
ncbi:MAG: beta-ketoacyl synthase N-terminal-like domain-containing protein [Victivallaceae bacterium]|nr:beta-ketoacyl synthase N-terminal-like domain-containing protein [Victivallaceae bacterium]